FSRATGADDEERRHLARGRGLELLERADNSKRSAEEYVGMLLVIGQQPGIWRALGRDVPGRARRNEPSLAQVRLEQPLEGLLELFSSREFMVATAVMSGIVAKRPIPPCGERLVLAVVILPADGGERDRSRAAKGVDLGFSAGIRAGKSSLD